ncbi:MAG: helix-hairpin-helix domain-containing protein [Ignavibacteriae bacterium]|nr:helix-hairpin-helix domain-containing protein [Ignavibacteriota bacterium]
MEKTQKEILKEFTKIPSVGKSISLDLWDLGYRSVSELKNQNPEKMYKKFCKMKGQLIDRCLLYTFRCAVYYASNKVHDPELLKWWNWKDK